MSWDTEMTGDLPDQVIASGGLSGTSGTIAWATQNPVSDRPVSPWAKVAGWPPSPGDVVRVRVTDGTTWWTRWTGVIDKTTGDPTSGYESKIIDFRDQITGSFTHEALLRHMPPFIEDGDYRSIGLNFWYPLTQALRTTGFFNVPPIEPYSEVSVPMQGSMWPEAGTVSQAGGTDGQIHATFYRTDYGYAAGSLDTRYVPRLNAPTTDPVQITLGVPDTHHGVAVVNVIYGTARNIRLRVNTGRTVTAFFSPTGAEPWTTVASVSMGDADTVTLLVKNGDWVLRTNTGGQATGTQALGPGDLSSIRVNADIDSRIAGFQVSHPNSSSREFMSLDFTPNVRFDPSGLASTMDMMPALRGRSINDLVNEILEATLTASWWDETGTLVLRPSDRLRGTEPSQTVTTADDITALSWEDSLLAVRSAVEVAWQDPLISKTYQHRLELWRGRTQTLISTADPIEDFVTPESGIEWFGVDRTLRFLDDSNWGAYNKRRGSYCGVWYSNADGDPTTAGDVRVRYEPMYADSLKVTTLVMSLISTYEANTETHPEATALKAYLRGQSLPVVRGMGRGEWVDATYRATAGPSTAPVLAHDLGYWGHEYFEGGSVAQRIGDYLAQMVAAPQPTITDLGLVYDPRRQVGDVYTLTSDWLGIELRLLVTRISEEHGDGSHQTVTVRVISAESTRPVTYGDLAAAWATGDYAGLDAVWNLLDYNDFAAEPLEGAPE
ncbi:MAG: hypothetical protein L0G94_03890 [Brachybacterium sp.]|uniref:hypothetical protein n=1 Tax=Brachybacterium sp. TaxID=1891286 RepID=UPI00264999DC|nr:hypothetical protein [Brachybacterium sp.]MDN5685811.1 hypothetical protein [Brachybacterium sp.]